MPTICQRFAQQLRWLLPGSTVAPWRPSGWLLVAVLCVGLAACGSDEGSQRRFANQPLPTEQPPLVTATVSVVPPVTPSAPPVSPVAAATLLAAGGGPSIVYMRSGDDLLAFKIGSAGPRTIYQAIGAQIRAVAASPTGDRVAVLLTSAPNDPSTASLIVLTADGHLVKRFDALDPGARSQGGTPGPGAAGGSDSLDWSRAGDRILVGFSAGGLIAVPLDGNPVVLIGAQRAQAPAEAAWSPKGDALAYVDPARPGMAANLYVAPTGATPLDPAPVVSADTNGHRTVAQMRWLPNGAAILYSLLSPDGDISRGGDLYAVAPGGGPPRLIASAGRAGPIAAISRFAPAPDGHAVAYTVVAPDERGTSFHSLWVQQIDGPTVIRLPVPPGESVTDLWWTAAGLVWRTVANRPGSPAAGAGFALYLAAPDGSATVLYRGVAPPPPTPGASPVASPKASPIASPAATPPAP